MSTGSSGPGAPTRHVSKQQVISSCCTMAGKAVFCEADHVSVYHSPTKSNLRLPAASHMAHDLPSEVTIWTTGLLTSFALLVCSASGTWFDMTPRARKGVKSLRSLTAFSTCLAFLTGRAAEVLDEPSTVSSAISVAMLMLQRQLLLNCMSKRKELKTCRNIGHTFSITFS